MLLTALLTYFYSELDKKYKCLNFGSKKHAIDKKVLVCF